MGQLLRKGRVGIGRKKSEELFKMEVEAGAMKYHVHGDFWAELKGGSGGLSFTSYQVDPHVNSSLFQCPPPGVQGKLGKWVTGPRYLFPGKTSLEEWRNCIQESQAPWGELATDNIILTVPSANLKDLEDPEPALRLWDEMMGAIAQLAARPFPFCRPERIVADVQISAGGCS